MHEEKYMPVHKYATISPIVGHYSMMIVTLYTLGIMILPSHSFGQVPSTVVNNQALSRPRLLPIGSTPPTVSLKDAFVRALEHHVQLRLAKNQREQKQAERWTSIGGLLPKLRLTSAYTRNIPEKEASMFDMSSLAPLNRQVASMLRKSGDNVGADQLDQQADLMQRRGADKAIVFNPKDVVDGKLSLEVPLFNGLAITKALVSHQNVLVHDAKVDEEKATTLYATAKAYFLALYLQHVLEVRKQAEGFAEVVFKKSESQRKRGLIMDKDFKAAKANWWQKQADRKGAELDYRASIGELGLIMGMNEEFSLSRPDDMIFDALKTDTDKLLAIALSNRADLKAGEHALAIAERERTGQFLGFLPTVWLKGDANYTSNNKSMIGETFTYALSLNASLALFDGGTSISALWQSSLKRQESEIKLRQIKTDIDVKIRGAQEKLAHLELKEKASSLRLEATQEAARVAMERYNKGLIVADEFLEIEDKKIEADLVYKKSHADFIEEKLALTYEAGLLTPQWVQ
jgi:outer membrane protein TolC